MPTISSDECSSSFEDSDLSPAPDTFQANKDKRGAGVKIRVGNMQINDDIDSDN